MVRSMTGFGRGMTNKENGRSFTIEIKSVNHRYLDLNVKMPRDILSLETKIRETIKGKVNRGKIDVFINQNIYADDDIEVNFNEKLADSYFKCLQNIRNRYDVTNDVSVSLIAKFPEAITTERKEEDLEEIWSDLQEPLLSAIDSLIKMREVEGMKLKEDIIEKSKVIEKLLSDIEMKAPLLVDEYRNKLNTRVKELLDNSEIDENRIAMEVALFADKAAIDEEIVRLKSHINQLKQTLEKDEPIGRKLDFIIQEMNREANTISSKSSDLDITNSIINVKNYIEKIREQTQNIE